LVCIEALSLSFPATGQYDFTASAATGCTPMRVKYGFTSTATVDTISSFYWDFGNGQTSTLESPDSVTYLAPGTYTAVLVFNGRADLMIVKPDLITVHQTVPADFVYYDTVTYYTYVFNHTEPLDPAAEYTFLWDFQGVGSRSGRKEVITFPSADTFLVSLTVSDNFGCSSFAQQTVIIQEEISVQNVFTPNGDNFNDFFMVTSNGGFPLKLKVFTRAGILVYEAEGTNILWDGYAASGQQLKEGVYFYTIEAIEGDPKNRYSKAGLLYMYK